MWPVPNNCRGNRFEMEGTIDPKESAAAPTRVGKQHLERTEQSPVWEGIVGAKVDDACIGYAENIIKIKYMTTV